MRPSSIRLWTDETRDSFCVTRQPRAEFLALDSESMSHPGNEGQSADLLFAHVSDPLEGSPQSLADPEVVHWPLILNIPASDLSLTLPDMYVVGRMVADERYECVSPSLLETHVTAALHTLLPARVLARTWGTHRSASTLAEVGRQCVSPRVSKMIRTNQGLTELGRDGTADGRTAPAGLRHPPLRTGRATFTAPGSPSDGLDQGREHRLFRHRRRAHTSLLRRSSLRSTPI